MCATSDLLNRSCSVPNFPSHPMESESCSVTRIISLGGIAIYFCSLIFRVLPKLLGFICRSLKKLCRDGHLRPLLFGTAIGTLPELPQDILICIFSTLEIPDLVRAGSVCSSWRSACTSLRSLGQYTLPQTPCLLYTPKSAGDSVACLYSLAEKRSYELTLPEPPIRTRCLIGSSNGWLVTVDERSEMHLLNPITSEQIALPSVITIEQVKPIFDAYGVLHKYELSWRSGTRSGYNVFALDKLRDELQYKAFVFSDDASTGGYIVVLIHNPMRQLSFARVGGDRWNLLPPHDCYEDCTYKDGLLYAVTGMGELHVFDLHGPDVKVEMILKTRYYSDCGYMYIVQAPWGDLLLVWRIFEDYDLEPDPGTPMFWNTTEYRIYEYDPSGSKFKEINCLRDHVLFLGHNHSLCLSADEYPSLKANHVYSTDDNVLWILKMENDHRDMGILNLDDNCREEIVSPRLWSNRPAPIWITPDLKKWNLVSGGVEEKGSTDSISQQRNGC